jgi:glycosyltransferase involved in cell wall biosynthesis
MNILFVTESFYPDGIGGIHTYAYELAKALIDRKHMVCVIAPRFDKTLKKEENIDGIKIFRYNSISKGFLLYLRRPILSVVNSYLLFRKLRKKQFFNVINFHSALPAFAINLFVRNVKKIYTFHASMYQEVVIQSKKKKYSRFFPLFIILNVIKWMEKINLILADRIIVLSRFNERQLVDLYAINILKVKIIPGGVNTKEYKPASNRIEIRNKLNIPETKTVLFTARRLVSRMGLENLIYAMAKVKKKFENCILIIAGEGFLKSKLIDIALKEKLNDTIFLKGGISNEQLKLYYRASDLFVLPTKKLEGFGLVTLEALSSGLPVAATPIGGTVEILKPFDESLLFKGTSSYSIGQGIIDLLKKPDDLKALRGRCRDYAIQNFAWTKIALRYENYVK